MEIKISRMMDALGFGYLLKDSVAVRGGFLHKMYHVATSAGEFAVKVLNPEIMKRPDALSNMVHSEQIAKAFEKDIPLVAALEVAGHQLQNFEGDAYLIFPWLPGASVFSDQITPGHCEKIGDILGKMHQKKLQMEGVAPEEGCSVMLPWEEYLHKANTLEADALPWIGLYKNALADIQGWNRRACAAEQRISGLQVISHRDLDPKNVLWKEGSPYVIDWEAAGYVNPQREFLETVNYWADDGAGGLVKEKFDCFAKAYSSHMDLRAVEWDAALEASCLGMLGWLEYNIKRALGLEASGKEEMALGEEQAGGTIRELYHYQAKRKTLKEWLSAVK